jgi:hypothetical protein
MAAKHQIITQQTGWAKGRGLEPDSRSYLASYQANLFQPLSASARSAFNSGSGNELRGTVERPAKMSALHSSSALAVNVFDYWSDRPDVVLAALNLPTGAVSLVFEKQFPTGLNGNPPNLDLAMKWADGTWLGIESKFTEWLTPKPASKEHFKPKYFPQEEALWAGRGLARCQELAALVHTLGVIYRHLDAAQLLKHALGLACSGSKFELLYLYFDLPGLESSVHRAELEDFSNRIAGDFPFHVRRYQDVVDTLASKATAADTEYLEYLAGRYFGGTQPVVVDSGATR